MNPLRHGQAQLAFAVFDGDYHCAVGSMKTQEAIIPVYLGPSLQFHSFGLQRISTGVRIWDFRLWF